MSKQELRIETPLGTLVAYTAIDPNYPGIYIDLERNGIAMPVGLVEVNVDDDEDIENILVSRIWGDGQQEDYTRCIVHEGVEEFFRNET